MRQFEYLSENIGKIICWETKHNYRTKANYGFFLIRHVNLSDMISKTESVVYMYGTSMI